MKLELEDIKTGKKWIANQIKEANGTITFCDGKEHYHHPKDSDYASCTGMKSCDCQPSQCHKEVGSE